VSGKARKAAPRPKARTVTARISGGDFDGWEATARADFPTRLVVDLNSGDLGKILDVLDRIITDHNMPDSDGNIAEHLADVDPYSGLLAIANAVGAELGRLPNR
jgi:hypothetical protein